MIKALFAGSRFVVGLAIVATFAGSVVLFVLAAIAVLRVIWVEVSNFSFEGHTANHVDHRGVQFIEITDTILLGVAVVLLGVTFLGEVVDWDTQPNQSNILFLGAAIALVAASLGLFLWISPRDSARQEETPAEPRE